MTYVRALFRCIGCSRRTPEGLLCLKCAAKADRFFHTLRREARDSNG